MVIEVDVKITVDVDGWADTDKVRDAIIAHVKSGGSVSRGTTVDDLLFTNSEVSSYVHVLSDGSQP